MAKKTELYLLLAVCFLGLIQRSTALLYWTALVDINYHDNQTNQTVRRYCECGLYGRNSPLQGAAGIVTLPISDPMGCGPEPFNRNSSSPPWIALIKRGNCTFSEKINAAKRQGAAAVVLYNEDGTGNRTTNMAHSEATGIVAIMIGNFPGMEIVNLIVKKGLEVRMVIEPGTAHGPWMDTYWLYFLSIAFFIVTAASIAYFVFISAHRLHNMRVQRSAERRLKNEAKKAIRQLEVRTMKRGDEETMSECHTCAICIDGYKVGEVVTVLTCGHIFHKTCIEPWLLEKRTCPMCKCDILKALGVEVEEEKQDVDSASPPDVTVVTVSGGEPLYEVPLGDPPTPDPRRHHYDNRGFEGDLQDQRQQL